MIVVVGFMSHVLTWNIVNCDHRQNLAALNVQIMQIYLILHTVIFQPLIQIYISGQCNGNC